ncbi:hypothetical protein O0I10_011885 [Lichtheimia ornata]|uniref:Uncharacterized protein n=1 Tax=Lichtheimia ornata TaxID=688661 RepID=A0AAD7UTR9_9FUNG|nr:uncharacterized protein O0I10_011885 [Lichtheimia ornata]KAJ8652487.1 hypothetical protein O0I10_011885 [Lichtheimia ornata]
MCSNSEGASIKDIKGNNAMHSYFNPTSCAWDLRQQSGRKLPHSYIAGVSSEPMPLPLPVPVASVLSEPVHGPSSSDDTIFATATPPTTSTATDTLNDTLNDTLTHTLNDTITYTTTTITTIHPWDLMTHSKWSKLGGAHTKREFKWKKEQLDLLQVFGNASQTMLRLQLQQLLITVGPSPTNYIIIKVASNEKQSKLDTLQQKVDWAIKPVAAEDLHFAVAHTSGEWSSEQVHQLAQEVKQCLQASSSSSEAAVNESFKCNKIAFLNTDNSRRQVLGVALQDAHSAGHKMIGIIQDAFQTTKGINMEETPHITLLKRISNKTQSAQSRNDKVDEVVKDELPNDYDYLGELEIKEVIFGDTGTFMFSIYCALSAISSQSALLQNPLHVNDSPAPAEHFHHSSFLIRADLTELR